jgi:N-acetylmuramic acid 6-phosphate etherase
VADPRITEQRNPRTADLDLVDPLTLVDLLNAEDRQVAAAVAAARVPIAELLVVFERTLRGGGRVYYFGAGTSGRLGVLDASELPPTFRADPAQVQGVIAGGPAALTVAQEGAEDDLHDAAVQVDARAIGAGDLVIGIAASGTTPWVQAALAHARSRGATTALIACSPPPPAMRAVVDHPILVPVGPEAVTGSTRLKAGTATKLVLNTLSTGAMVRLGKTWGNLMVDLRATNDKLRERSTRIVMEVTGLEQAGAERVLRAADGRVKVALVMQLLGVDAETAAQRLQSVDGVVRRLVPSVPPIAD